MHQINTPLKYDGKDMHITITEATKEEREALQVIQLTVSTIFSPPNVNKEEIKRIRNFKIKNHHCDNLQQSMGGMGEETLMRTARNTTQHYLEQIEQEKKSLPRKHRRKRLHGIFHKRVPRKTRTDTLNSKTKPVRNCTCF